MQQKSESADAIHFCENNDISVVAGERILMFAEPVEFYRMIAGCGAAGEAAGVGISSPFTGSTMAITLAAAS